MGDISDVIDIDSIADELEYLYGTKQAIADAINEVGESQGITVTSADTFRSYADKIRKFGQCEVGKISVRTTPLYDEEIGTCQTFEAPEGKVWKEVKVHIDAWSAVTQEVDPLIISENGFYDINEMSASKFAFSEVQNPTGNPKQKGYFERIRGKYYPTEDTEVVEGKTYYVEDKTREYETASSFIINVQRSGAAPFTCDFCDEAGNVVEHHEGIPYGGWCTYEGSTPVSSSGLAFQGWNPAPNNIQTNMKCYPMFYTPHVSAEEWPESWAEIVVKHGEGIPIGAWKTLPLTDTQFEVDGVTYQINQPPKMFKVYNGEDVSTSSWLSSNIVIVYPMNDAINEGTMANGNFPYDDESGVVKIRKILNEGLMSIVPDYIRQFIVPVTKYFSAAVINNGVYVNNMSILKVQDYIWLPSARELNAAQDTYFPSQTYNLMAGRGVVYSDIFDGTPENRAAFFADAWSDPNHRYDVQTRDGQYIGGSYHYNRAAVACVDVTGYYSRVRGNMYREHPNGYGISIGFCL